MCKSKYQGNIFALKTPCKNCPFRSDKVFPPLGKRRIQGIVDSIRSDNDFPCHKTTEFDEDENGEQITVESGAWCAGALAMLEATGETNNHFKLRLAQLFGAYSPLNLRLKNTPIFQSWADLIAYHSMWD